MGEELGLTVLDWRWAGGTDEEMEDHKGEVKSRMALLTAVMATSVQAFVRWFAGAEGRPARGHSPPYCTCSQIYIRNGPHQ